MNTQNRKIIEVGQQCRYCGTPVIKRIPRQKPRGKRAYYFDYYLWCSKCPRLYFIDSEKRFWSESPDSLRLFVRDRISKVVAP